MAKQIDSDLRYQDRVGKIQKLLLEKDPP